MTDSSYPIDINKALFFIFLCIFLFLWLTFNRLIPATKELKTSKVRHYQARSLYYDSKRYHDERLDELKKIKQANKKITNYLNTDFSMSHLQDVLNKSMTSLMVIAHKKTKYNEYFGYLDLDVSGVFAKTDLFFKSIIDLNKMGYIISIEFPIHISKNNSNSIKVNFGLKDHFLTDLNTTLKEKDE